MLRGSKAEDVDAPEVSSEEKNVGDDEACEEIVMAVYHKHSILVLFQVVNRLHGCITLVSESGCVLVVEKIIEGKDEGERNSDGVLMMLLVLLIIPMMMLTMMMR